MAEHSGEQAEAAAGDIAAQSRKRLRASRGVLVLSIMCYIGGLVGLYLLPDELSR
jgi:hypothetical protein